MSIKRNHKDEIDNIFDYGFCPKTREIFLYERGDGISYLQADSLLKQLSYLESINTKPIIIHLHSIGGQTDIGFSMFDRIKASSCKIIFLIHGTVCSFGSLLPQAAYNTGIRLCMPHATWMLHSGSISLDSTYKQASSYMDMAQKEHNKMLDIWLSVLVDSKKMKNKSEAYVHRFLQKKFNEKEDWWMFAEEAIEYNLCDKIIYNISELEDYKDV